MKKYKLILSTEYESDDLSLLQKHVKQLRLTDLKLKAILNDGPRKVQSNENDRYKTTMFMEVQYVQ